MIGPTGRGVAIPGPVRTIGNQQRRLTWWPSHAPSSEHMKVHVENELPSIPVAVDYQSIPAFGVPALPRHLRRCDEKMTDALRIGSSDLIDGLNVL